MSYNDVNTGLVPRRSLSFEPVCQNAVLISPRSTINIYARAKALGLFERKTESLLDFGAMKKDGFVIPSSTNRNSNKGQFVVTGEVLTDSSDVQMVKFPVNDDESEHLQLFADMGLAMESIIATGKFSQYCLYNPVTRVICPSLLEDHVNTISSGLVNMPLLYAMMEAEQGKVQVLWLPEPQYMMRTHKPKIISISESFVSAAGDKSNGVGQPCTSDCGTWNSEAVEEVLDRYEPGLLDKFHRSGTGYVQNASLTARASESYRPVDVQRSQLKPTQMASSAIALAYPSIHSSTHRVTFSGTLQPEDFADSSSDQSDATSDVGDTRIAVAEPVDDDESITTHLDYVKEAKPTTTWSDRGRQALTMRAAQRLQRDSGLAIVNSAGYWATESKSPSIAMQFTRTAAPDEAVPATKDNISGAIAKYSSNRKNPPRVVTADLEANTISNISDLNFSLFANCSPIVDTSVLHDENKTSVPIGIRLVGKAARMSLLSRNNSGLALSVSTNQSSPAIAVFPARLAGSVATPNEQEHASVVHVHTDEYQKEGVNRKPQRGDGLTRRPPVPVRQETVNSTFPQTNASYNVDDPYTSVKNHIGFKLEDKEDTEKEKLIKSGKGTQVSDQEKEEAVNLANINDKENNGATGCVFARNHQRISTPVICASVQAFQRSPSRQGSFLRAASIQQASPEDFKGTGNDISSATFSPDRDDDIRCIMTSTHVQERPV